MDILALPLHVAIADFKSRRLDDSLSIIKLLWEYGATLHSRVAAILPEFTSMSGLDDNDFNILLDSTHIFTQNNDTVF